MSHLKPIDDESEDIYNSVGYIKEMFSKKDEAAKEKSAVAENG